VELHHVDAELEAFLVEGVGDRGIVARPAALDVAVVELDRARAQLGDLVVEGSERGEQALVVRVDAAAEQDPVGILPGQLVLRVDRGGPRAPTMCARAIVASARSGRRFSSDRS
jgi:hypothetical protein